MVVFPFKKTPVEILCQIFQSEFWKRKRLQLSSLWQLCAAMMSELDDELSWLFNNRLSATRLMKVKRMGITEILRRIWLFSANKIKSSESGSKSFSKQPTQLIIELNSSLRHIIVTLNTHLVLGALHKWRHPFPGEGSKNKGKIYDA